tara:strand:+ start:10036 stop:11070 length:1035 start_codon:yes stop_codon:yes gene_type:complete
MSQMIPTIEVQNLCKQYGATKAIENISFSVMPGEVVGFLGPNGAGKSTTMRILCGLMAGTSGRVSICGVPVATRAHEAKRHIGYMPENNPLPRDMRVLEYLRYRARLKEVPGKIRNKRVDEVMDLCDINRKTRHKLIGSLSKGYRQRVGIADAILAEPELVIMDEPTIGLDPHQIRSIRALIDSLRGKMTLLFSSHILPEVEASCDRVIIINQGRIVAEGTTASLREIFGLHSTYTLSVKAPRSAFMLAVDAIDPQKIIQSESMDADGFLRFTIRTGLAESFGEAMSEAIRQHPEWCLRELSLKQPNLEDIFVAATARSWEQTLENSENLNKENDEAFSQLIHS